LLVGPPGTGKTDMAKAAATEIDAAFFNVRSSDIMSKWVGDAEKNVAKLFQEARKYKRAIIFLDDVEELMTRNQDSGNGVNNRVVGEFLTNLSGITSRTNQEGTAVLLMAATNEPFNIAAPMLRRFDNRVVYIGLPTLKEREAIIAIKLLNIPLDNDINFSEIAKITEGYSGAELKTISDKCKMAMIKREIVTKVRKPLTQSILKAHASSVRPVATVEMLAKLNQFNDKYGLKIDTSNT